jgi:hypothetical protein
MSGSNPIAADVENELNGTERGKQASRHAGGYPGLASENVQFGPISSSLTGNDFLSDLLDAQQRLISAQHQYLHDNDMRALARAQLDVIGVQNSVLGRLGVFG